LTTVSGPDALEVVEDAVDPDPQAVTSAVMTVIAAAASKAERDLSDVRAFDLAGPNLIAVLNYRP
jgi:hypothetical protein